MATQDREILAHKAWLGFLQPVGVVVSPPALIKAQAFVNRSIVEEQQRFQALLSEDADGKLVLADFPAFTREVLGWYEDDLKPFPTELEVSLPDYEDVLLATWVVAESAETQKPTLVIQELPFGTDLDNSSPQSKNHQGWQASPQARIERLLRENQIPAGILFNGAEVRLVYAPRGETSGHLTFPVAFMAEVAGRYVFGGMHMLLEADRLFDGRLLPEQRLSALLSESRKYQSEVSTRLAEQVLDALWELLRGFQAADEAVDGRLLGETSREDPQHIYGGLLTVLLRSVFLLYAEDRGLMPQSHVYQTHYAVAGLFERLREDAGLYPDTMDHRYGAWAWMLSLFRLVFDGAHHEGLKLPARHGQLFDPDEYPFLEGRPYGIHRVMGDRIEPPRISDGVVFRVLQNLLVLDGERLSYRALDVEQIGSVYEAMMGFEVERAYGPSIALKPSGGGLKGHVVVDLGELLAMPGAKRAAWLKDQANCDVSGVATTTVKDATTIEEVVTALEQKISPRTKNVLPMGSLFLQPGEERRRSGSHYTPRELTEPIVSTTLRPVLDQLGPKPTPEQILGLKVCDPAMGSGAFLVEACRHLADKLVEAWEQHDCLPEIPLDEEPVLHARRMVAQHCLCGVDKNPFAVNLAKLSLWLVTLARDHAFTFLDHTLKCGDSLVGLSAAQIATGSWGGSEQILLPLARYLSTQLSTAQDYRFKLVTLGDDCDIQKRLLHKDAEGVLDDARMIGNMTIAAFFGSGSSREREAKRSEYWEHVGAWHAGGTNRAAIAAIEEEFRADARNPTPFHWEIEFPEVFSRRNSGFDAIIGNPPYLGGQKITGSLGTEYRIWLIDQVADGARGSADLAAYFLVRACMLIREGGTLGFVTTNTISQGATREVGLEALTRQGFHIYAARNSFVWPGEAHLEVSIVHILRGEWDGPHQLDGSPAKRISPFLDGSRISATPQTVDNPRIRAFKGSEFGGDYFLLQTDEAPILRNLPGASKFVRPLVSGEDLLQRLPPHASRWVIYFGKLTIGEARAAAPGLMQSLAERCPPKHRANWWQLRRPTVDLYTAIDGQTHTLACPQTGNRWSVALIPTDVIATQSLIVFDSDSMAAFSVLQSRVHESWKIQFGPTLRSDARYTVSDCFDTFVFPDKWEEDTYLMSTGERYYQCRASLMVESQNGLTKTYNRFHDPDERSPDILKLRELHAEMDRAVLDVYGWSDIPTDCGFFLDYEIDEEEWNPRKKKPWRYRWPDEVHDEVLARLLDLNQKRSTEEKLKGTVKKTAPKAPKEKKPKKSAPPTLFGLEDN